MEEYNKAKKYLNKNYIDIMSLYSRIYTQIESELSDLPVESKNGISAYYTVLSHRYLKSNPLISKIEKAIKKNLDDKLSEFDSELAIAILVESRIHELEKRGLITINRNSETHVTEISLTEEGKDLSEKLGADIRNSDINF
mgnify:FL=1